MNSISTLRQLSNIIADAVDDIERAYKGSGKALPSLDHPFDAKDPFEALLKDAAVSAATKNIMAATAQLSAAVCDPRRGAVNMSKSFLLSSCLRVASELDVVEFLREAGPKGASAGAIAAACKVDAGLMTRVLRLLATHYVFQEVGPDVFDSNRLSSVLEKGKPASFARTEKKG
ncbi:hypothetical protein B0H14DRAFT_3554195 [Mycena olivaceomarginata]|nr:hypothetical protein B0H14DRAFT_3554195 [Mycena olivaceomarginata]